LAKRAQYFGHFDSRIRRLAAFSLMAEGEASMPFILEALGSDDTRVIRAGCDAIAGSFGMNGLGKGNYRDVMTPDIAGAAVPQLLPLIQHEDMYVREGALLALSNCGKAAAAHLDKLTTAADDEDWWVRSAVAQVLHYVPEPETAEQIAATIKNYLAEESTFGRNRLRSAVVAMAKRGHGAEQAVAALIQEAKGDNGYHAGQALGALAEIGPAAKPALPLFEEKLARAKERMAAAKDNAERRRIEKDVRRWERVIQKTTGGAD
jgi:HEAT repeat protein